MKKIITTLITLTFICILGLTTCLTLCNWSTVSSSNQIVVVPFIDSSEPRDSSSSSSSNSFTSISSASSLQETDSSSVSHDSSFEEREVLPLIFPDDVSIDDKIVEVLYEGSDMWTQGMCSCQNGFFVTQSTSSQGQYSVLHLSSNGKIIKSSHNTFNHANGISYDSSSNKLYICKFAAESGTDGCDRTCDFSFYVVDADTFEIEKEIDLYNVVKGVCDDSIGIGGIAYNNETGKLCVLTRKPKRYIIFLNDDFTYDYSLYICDDNGEVLFGDICWLENYIAVCYWEWNQTNTVSFYNLAGDNIDNIKIHGITHIESIDFYENRLIANFNDFSNDIDTKILAIESSNYYSL